jgi:Trk-type K+ transport system membrane component
VVGSTALTTLGAALLVGIETSPARWQLRNPRPDTPGRLMVATIPSASTPAAAASSPATPASAESAPSQPSERARAERLQSQSDGQRWASALFQSAAARTGGMRIVRLDENSLAPASRVVLMCLMLAGGEVGGTAGGIRLMVLFLVLGTLFSKGPPPTDAASSRRATGRQHALTIAVGATFALLVIIAVTTLALTYREAGSPQACLFEAVSVCCNVGLSAGLTGPQLSPQGIVTLILAMFLARVIPLAILLRSRLVSLAATHPARGEND